ncbi:MAG: hypothetical protein SFY32_04775 [Bacteroidota bacterium]|nr:hypothetical protein [Bacteroidota bacterium]
MKNRNTILKTISASLALSILIGCSTVDMKKLAKEQKLTSVPDPLELHGDSVKFEISAVIPPKMLKKNKLYTVRTFYKSFDNTLTVGAVVFNGNDFPLAATEPPKLSKKFAFAYDDKIKKGDVFIEGEMSDINKIGKKTPQIPLVKGIITTSRLVKDVFPVAYADHGYDNREQLQPTVVQFYYPKRVSKLQPEEKKGNRAKFFEGFIASKYVTRTVNIIGTHSPEGAEMVNEKLSEERAIAIEKYYREMMKKFNYGTKADSISFVIKGKVKDWTDFKVKLDSNKTLTADQKAEITVLIDNPDGTFRQKELKLQGLKYYKVIEKQIYPTLRNARTEVLTVKPKKSDAQIFLTAMKIANGNAEPKDSLTPAELLYAATLTPTPEEKEKIYLAATKKLDSYEAYNNLGALILEKAIKEKDATRKGQLADDAIAKLEIAKNRQETGTVYLNLASAKLIKADKAGTAEAVAKAKSLGGSPEVTKGSNAIQGVLDIKAGNYESAMTNLNSAGNDVIVGYDKALALLLKKDLTSAKSAFDESLTADATNAYAFYCAAITAAKLNDADNMNKFLKEAFKLDDTLKNRALDDLEFVNYKENDKFKDALK